MGDPYLLRGGVNYEVVRRIQPCAWYADSTTTKCRWCQMLHHVRVQGYSSTLCGHSCLEEDEWMHLPDTHPEDIEQMDRCMVCYRRAEFKEEVIL